jgi:hypothetical protein
MLTVRRNGRAVAVSILTTTKPSADGDRVAPSSGLSFRGRLMQLRSTWFQPLRIRSGPHRVIKNRTLSEEYVANS